MQGEPVQPSSALIMGAAGAGKTYSIATLLEAGLEVFVLITEAGGVDSLLQGVEDRKLPIDKLHWHVVKPTAAGWTALEQMAIQIGTKSYEDLSKIKTGIGKDKTREQMIELLKAFKDFPDDRTGECFGDVTEWGPDRALVIDALSGISEIAMAGTVGYKPTANQGEWGVAMNFELQLMRKLTNDRKCFFVVYTHVEKEQNELTGLNTITASALGRKNAPRLAKMFSEVIYATRTKDSFRWSTIENNVETKNRLLPIGDNLSPTLVPLVEAWRKKQKFAASATPASGEAQATTPATPEVATS